MHIIKLTEKEHDALISFMAAIINDDAFENTYGLTAQEKAAVRRVLDKVARA